jgi:hypothetical protein
MNDAFWGALTLVVLGSLLALLVVMIADDVRVRQRRRRAFATDRGFVI